MQGIYTCLFQWKVTTYLISIFSTRHVDPSLGLLTTKWCDGAILPNMHHIRQRGHTILSKMSAAARKWDIGEYSQANWRGDPWKCWLCILWIFSAIRGPPSQDPATPYLRAVRIKSGQTTPLKGNGIVWPKEVVNSDCKWKGQSCWSHSQHRSSSKKGAQGLLASYVAAAEGHYHPKSFMEEEDMKALLLWKLGGNWVAQINHHASGALSVSYLRTPSTVPPIVPSHQVPTLKEVEVNVDATLHSVLDAVHSQIKSKVLHTVIMFDELATKKRIRWDPKTNFFLGVCRQHTSRTLMEFVNEGDMEELFQCLDDGVVHYAAEVRNFVPLRVKIASIHIEDWSDFYFKATVAALGILCKDNRIYPGRPVLISGDCKRETGEEHADVIQTVLDGVNNLQGTTRLWIVSIASDGESRRGAAFILLTFKRQLLPESPIYPLLKPLTFLNLHVGDDDLTCDKDWKHVFKRFPNLLLRHWGVVIDGFRIKPSIIKDHFKSSGLSADSVVPARLGLKAVGKAQLFAASAFQNWSLSHAHRLGPAQAAACGKFVRWLSHMHKKKNKSPVLDDNDAIIFIYAYLTHFLHLYESKKPPPLFYNIKVY